MLIGPDRDGKTSVGRSLKGEEFRKDESSTEGVQMDTPLKHVGAKPWTNSTEEQEMTAFDHKCALYVSDHLSTLISKGKALGKEKLTEKMADEKELSIDDELHVLQEKTTATKDVATHMFQSAAEPESNVNCEDDIPDKVTRRVIKNLLEKKSDNEDGIWPVIWDFPHQAIYRPAIDRIFVSRETIYVLVFDLTKDLSATNLDHIIRYMDLVCHQPDKPDKADKSDEFLPPVILVGTHADLLLEDPKDKMTKVKDKIRGTARVFSNHIIGKTFTVNNTLAGKQEEDPQIVSLRQEILKVGEEYMLHIKKKVPLKWLQVENEVYDLVGRKSNYITMEDFKKYICDKFWQFENGDDFEELLGFLHDRGTVVYHVCANNEPSLVVLKPKWLVDILCQIMTVEVQSEEKIRIQNLRDDLEHKAILHEQLLDDSCKRLKPKAIKDALLDIMKKFNLLCEYTSKEGSAIYLVPCMLKLKPGDKLMLNILGKQEPAPVYIKFNTQYVPGGLFSRLVVHFVEYAQRIYPDQPKLYANFARFFIGDFTGIDFVCYKRVIEVRLWNPNSDSKKNPVEMEPDICSELLSFLKDSLTRLHKDCDWLRAVSWDLCARCDLCPPELVSRTTEECFRHEEKECCHYDCVHYVSVTETLFCCSRIDGFRCFPPKTWCQAKALEDTSRHKHDAVRSKRQWTSQDTQAIAVVPAKVACTETVMKEGTPTPVDLLMLAQSIPIAWMTIGRCLEISDAYLDVINARWPDETEKAYRMLSRWTQQNTSTATYRVLSKALCNEFINRRDLAECICYRAT